MGLPRRPPHGRQPPAAIPRKGGSSGCLADGPPVAAQTAFDFTTAARAVCDDIVRRVDALGHIDLARVAIRFVQARRPGRHGVFATLTPLRFAGGEEYTVRRGRRYRIQRIAGPQGEALYLLSFYLPRFLDLGYREKLSTIVHELWHIGPRFDGDLRRLGGRCYAHGRSQKQFDAAVEALTDRYLATAPPAAEAGFLYMRFHELVDRYGGVYGARIRTPRLIPLD